MESMRAVIYCRCSTEEESQVHALRNQVQESEACVCAQHWQLTDRYVESKSGTTTKGRDEYMRLYEDLLTDRFDIIVIKSQDRLMRNVKDWYLFLDRMQTRGKRLYIYLEHKFYTADDALIAGIKAILAEDYSRELSKKINHAHRSRQMNGGKAMLNSRTFGYRKLPDGAVAVVEEEAEIVREIFACCIAGYGTRSIANICRNQGYRKKTGTEFSSNSVRRIIRNPLYMGTLVMNRKHYDFETKREIRIPPEEWIYGVGQVPAIVSAEVWKQANSMVTERARKYRRDSRERENGPDLWNGNDPTGGPGRYQLSGKLICSQCGRPYYRVQRHSYGNREQKVIEWKCSTYLSKGRKKSGCGETNRQVEKRFSEGCDNVHLDEEILFRVLEQVCGEYYYDLAAQDKNDMIEHVISLLRRTLGERKGNGVLSGAKAEAARLRQQKEILLTKLLDGVISDQDYQKRNRQIEQKLESVQTERETLTRQEMEPCGLEQRLDQIRRRLEHGGFEKITAEQMLQDIQKIVVHEWQLEIWFEPGKLPGFAKKAVWVDYPFPPETERGRDLQRRRVIQAMKENPETTVKQVAEALGESPHMVRNRVEELISGGYIRFEGKGGHGLWRVLREMPDKEMSRKTDGL